MKALFVDFKFNNIDRLSIYPLISSLQNKQVAVSYINQRNFIKIQKEVEIIKPDLLLYSAFSSEIFQYQQFDKFIKSKMEIKSIIGGVGATLNYQNLQKSTINHICIGEGEKALEDYISNGMEPTANIISSNENFDVTKCHSFVDLNLQPFPNRDVVYARDVFLKQFGLKHFFAGRGCPFKCTNCYAHKYNEMFNNLGQSVRYKDIDYLFEEINIIKKKYPLKHIVFQDDTFVLNGKWLEEFSTRFPKEFPDLDYSCNIRLDCVDEDKIRMLKDSNCIAVRFGIESGNQTIRNQILKRDMTDEQIIKSTQLIKQYGIKSKAYNIIGFPGETFEQMMETLQLNLKVKPFQNETMILIPFTGTQIRQYAIQKGYLKDTKEHRFPVDGYHQSMLDKNIVENQILKKLPYLFSCALIFPILFKNNTIPKWVMKIPLTAIKIVGELIYYIQKFMLYRLYSFPIRQQLLLLKSFFKRGDAH